MHLTMNAARAYQLGQLPEEIFTKDCSLLRLTFSHAQDYPLRLDSTA